MKKLLLSLLAAMLLPLSAMALDLQPNQRILGHYTTDDLTLGGCWGKSLLRGTRPIATDLTPDELAMFQGSKIVAFRVGLSLSTQVSRVFVIPVSPSGQLGEQIEWNCNVSDEGWNIVELPFAYPINLPADYSLRIGFDYEQVGTAKPISAVNVGTIYPSYCYYNNKWSDYGVSLKGNLSLQLICENDNFPEYIIRIKDMVNKKKVKLGEDINYSFKAYTLGTESIPAGNLTFNVAIDGNVVKTLSNPATLTAEPLTISDVINTTGLTGGSHILTVSTATLNGEPIENPSYLTAQFLCFEYGFSRQMRLVEQFTSTYCTYCPLGSAALQALSDMRGDIAWVGVHQNMNGTDVFRTIQCDSIADLEKIDGYPEGSFDRTIGCNPEDPNAVYTVLSYNSATAGANVFNTFLDNVAEDPSYANVFINSTYDPSTRKAVITVNGELVPKYEDFMGYNSKLTVYITEDALVAPQYNNGSWVNNYVHNGVLRQAVGGVKGVALNTDGDTYKNEFTVTIPSAWKAENLNVVAFISRPLGNAVNDIFVTNCNKRKLGEFDEPVIIIGDADGNGIVDIDDVTALIDSLLYESSTVSPGADIDGNGEIDIDDVTTLIDMLLNGK